MTPTRHDDNRRPCRSPAIHINIGAGSFYRAFEPAAIGIFITALGLMTISRDGQYFKVIPCHSAPCHFVNITPIYHFDALDKKKCREYSTTAAIDMPIYTGVIDMPQERKAGAMTSYFLSHTGSLRTAIPPGRRDEEAHHISFTLNTAFHAPVRHLVRRLCTQKAIWLRQRNYATAYRSMKFWPACRLLLV